MKKNKSNLSAFDNLLNNVGYSNTIEQPETDDVSDIIDNDDIDDLSINNTDTTNIEDLKDDEEDIDPLNDDSNVPDNVLNTDQNTETELDNQDVSTEINETEQQNIGLFFDAFAEELGWDVDDDEKPTSVEGLVDYISKVIEENSVPQYADDRIAQLDAFVKNGGNFEDFYQRQQESVSYENMDMEDESNQKTVIRQFLKHQGYTDDQISKKIDRYEDSNMLEEEAEDAVSRLKQIRDTQLKEQQQQQEQIKQQQLQQANEFMNNLVSTVNSLDNIRGISIPKSDRKELFDYITKVDEDGLTRYQKDFNSNLVNNLIESAYFTMKGDTLLGTAKKDGSTSAANKLRTMLRHQSTNHSRYNINDDKTRSLVDIASQFYK